MCGICGKLSTRPIEKEEILQMANALQHRGPDDEGFYFADGVGLGHRRLSIIDLSTGRQPISNEDESVWIVFNGEIYNYRELRERLVEKGHRFATQTDTETIVHAYEEYGEACVRHLNGMFAFAIWDQKKRKLLLARDRIGQKPLFYAQVGGDFLFASEVKGLLADGEIAAQLDPEAMHHFLSLRFVPQPYTMFAGIKKLPPGHFLVHEKGRIRIERYWDLSYAPKFDGTEEDLVARLRMMLMQAVESHLVSDVPVGAYLSGGLDSTLVAAMAATIQDRPIQTFSMGIDQKGFNELPLARQVAERYGTDHHEWLVRPDILGTLPELIGYLDEPSDPLATCMFAISKLTRQHVKVVLGGDGGDELFGGYERYWGNLVLGYYSLLPAFIRRQVAGRLIDLLPDGRAYKSLAQKLRWMNTLSFYQGAERYAQAMIFPWFGPDAKRRLYAEAWWNKLEEESAAHIIQFYEGAQTDEIIDRMLHADLSTRLPEHSLMIFDRAAMAVGLEGRSPYLDTPLVEFAARIPTSLKLNGKRLRYIQKEVAKAFLPPALLTREKQGFSTALPYFLKGALREAIVDLLGDSQLARDGYFRREGVRALVEEHYAGGIDHSSRLWMLMNLEIWYRMKIRGASREQLQERMLKSQTAGVGG
jgi:asparagine synthase (glutamine-hydrolysing)